MSRIDLEDFEDKEIRRVYVAVNESEANRVENLLNDQEIDYGIALEPYSTFSNHLFPTTEKQGIVFYVMAGQRDYCRKLLESHCLRTGIIDEDLS